MACCREFSPQRRNKGNFFENDLSRGGGPHLANVPSVAPPRRTVAMAKGDTSQLRRGSVPRGRKGAWQEGSTPPPTTTALSPRPSSSLPSRRTRRRRRQTRRIRWRCARWILRRDAQRQTRGLRKCSSLRGSRGGSDGRLEFLFRFFGRIFYGENERAGRKSAKFATYFFFPVTRTHPRDSAFSSFAPFSEALSGAIERCGSTTEPIVAFLQNSPEDLPPPLGSSRKREEKREANRG